MPHVQNTSVYQSVCDLTSSTKPALRFSWNLVQKFFTIICRANLFQENRIIDSYTLRTNVNKTLSMFSTILHLFGGNSVQKFSPYWHRTSLSFSKISLAKAVLYWGHKVTFSVFYTFFYVLDITTCPQKFVELLWMSTP